MSVTLQDFDSAHFLQHYWQQRYGLFKQAVSGAEQLLDANELAGLALEDDVESRLIADGALAHGPFSEQQLQQFPDSNATLLVQAVDHYLPEVAELRDAFDFLPSWRVDDVMVSFASDGGGVGPHFDQYDVFLIQGEGQREWRIGPPMQPDDGHTSASGLRLLDAYDPIETITLHPGDMLYIPPGVAHWGISQGNSLCLSIGFRAPAAHEILQQWAADMADVLDESLRYRDPAQTELSRHELPVSNLDSLAALLQEKLSPATLAAAMAKLVSEPKYPENNAAIPDMSTTQALYKAVDARLLLCDGLLYANGHACPDSKDLPQALLHCLCNQDMIDTALQAEIKANPAGQAVLANLLALGVFEADIDELDSTESDTQ